MAAVVEIQRLTGAGPTRTTITSINTRANADDTHTTGGTTNPVRIPASGTNYSFWVSTQLNVISGLSGTIDNLKWFSSGSVGTGLTLNGMDATAYVQATGTVGTTGIVLNTTNHPNLTTTPVSVFTFTSGSPKSVPGSTTSSGPFGNLFVYQFAVASTASPGATSQPTFTWQYDET